MPELEIHVRCTGCPKITHLPVGTITEADYPRLRCRYCKARNPIVEVHELRHPFTPEYRKPSLVRVWPVRRE